MLTTAYEIPELLDLRAEVEEKGLLILNELGEVPGMDHFGTQMILEEIRAEGGRVISLNSYGSGLPSFEAWLEEYRAEPERVERYFMGLWESDSEPDEAGGAEP